MGQPETDMGGDRRDFPTTSLDLVLAVKDGAPDARRRHLERLIAAYWKPVYAFIRTFRRHADADAKDLTQGFFTKLVNDDALARFSPERGNFRSYLRQCLVNFLNQAIRDEKRLKRGGGVGVVSLEAVEIPDLAAGEDPHATFDAEWTRAILDRAIADLEGRLTSEGRAECLAVFRALALPSESERPPTYREVAQRLGIGETSVRDHLHAARTELRRILYQLVSEYATGDDELRAELASIIGEFP